MKSEFVTVVGNTHYMCVNDSSSDTNETGCGSQFVLSKDEHIRFPQNMVFADRHKEEFFRKDYLKLKSVK